MLETPYHSNTGCNLSWIQQLNYLQPPQPAHHQGWPHRVGCCLAPSISGLKAPSIHEYSGPGVVDQPPQGSHACSCVTPKLPSNSYPGSSHNRHANPPCMMPTLSNKTPDTKWVGRPGDNLFTTELSVLSATVSKLSTLQHTTMPYMHHDRYC